MFEDTFGKVSADPSGPLRPVTQADYKVYSNKSFLLLIIIIDNISSNDNSYYKSFYTELHIGHFSNGILEI